MHLDLKAALDAADTEQRRLTGEIGRLQAELRRLDAVSRAIAALRAPYRPVTFGGCEEMRAFFVSGLTLGPDAAIASLGLVLVPEVFGKCGWHKPHPNPDGSQTMTWGESTADEIVAELSRKYVPGTVVTGTPDDVLRQPCPDCGTPAFVYCLHYFDFDSAYQGIDVSRLCLACPAVTSIGGKGLDTDEPSLLLPPRTPPAPRRR